MKAWRVATGAALSVAAAGVLAAVAHLVDQIGDGDRVHTSRRPHAASVPSHLSQSGRDPAGVRPEEEIRA